MDKQLLEEKMKRLQDYGRSLPQAKVYYREDWNTIYFDILGKQFGLMSIDIDENSLITLKGKPEKNEELRELYDHVIPGYYANKVHWNSIYLANDELSEAEIQEMIKESYELVVAKLPKKVRRELLGED